MRCCARNYSNEAPRINYLGAQALLTLCFELFELPRLQMRRERHMEETRHVQRWGRCSCLGLQQMVIAGGPAALGFYLGPDGYH